MLRSDIYKSITTDKTVYDFVVIGGGATGLGIAVDAASRGYSVVLLERYDFSKGTSSRSTKLIHGGVRYLKQGQFGLVREALRERGYLARNAAHLVKTLPFVIPIYNSSDKWLLKAGLTLYDSMAGSLGLGRNQLLSVAETLEHLPGIKPKGLKGGILYYDAQFDDARLAIDLALTGFKQGALPLNYARVTNLIKGKVRLEGVEVQDTLTGENFAVKGRCIINATGVFVDDMRLLDDAKNKRIVTASRGSHLVLPSTFLPQPNALMVPKTTDGRVLFAVPWQGHVILGTTDIEVKEIDFEPRISEEEVEFMLHNARQYFERAPTVQDVTSCYSGLRPLIRPDRNESTSQISREHSIFVSASNLLTISGGKWTTYRKMAEDAVDMGIRITGLTRADCITQELKLQGCPQVAADAESAWGNASGEIKKLQEQNPAWAEKLHPKLPYTQAEIIWAIRHEMPATVEDLLARRTRSLFLNARASIEAATTVAKLLTAEKRMNAATSEKSRDDFRNIAQNFILQ